MTVNKQMCSQYNKLKCFFHRDGYVIQSDDFSRCCDTRESMCCHLSGQLGCYTHDVRDTTGE